MEVVVERLQGHNIKPSVQRIAIMKYLMEHRTHPTVDEIYTALSPTIPTLSKTTVYNTLKILSEQGAAQTLTIDERNTCYDADTTPHSHFLCKRCGRIYDLPCDAADIVLVSDDIRELPHLRRLARRMMRTIKCNLTFSMALNFIAIMLAVGGILNPVAGALVHNAGSVVVIVNSVFLLKWGSKKSMAPHGAEGTAP